jgi:hypothetical protein
MGSTGVPAGAIVSGGAFRSSTGRNVNVGMGSFSRGAQRIARYRLTRRRRRDFARGHKNPWKIFCVASHWVAACYATDVKYTTPTPPPERCALPEAFAHR